MKRLTNYRRFSTTNRLLLLGRKVVVWLRFSVVLQLRLKVLCCASVSSKLSSLFSFVTLAFNIVCICRLLLFRLLVEDENKNPFLLMVMLAAAVARMGSSGSIVRGNC